MCLSVYVWSAALTLLPTRSTLWLLCDIKCKAQTPDYRPTNHRQLVSWWTICDFSSSWKIRAEGSPKMVLQYFRFSIAQEKWSPQNGIRLQEHMPLQVKTNYCFHSIYLSVQLSLFCGGPVVHSAQVMDLPSPSQWASGCAADQQS